MIQCHTKIKLKPVIFLKRSYNSIFKTIFCNFLSKIKSHVKINRTHKHYWWPEKHTTQKYQVLVLLSHQNVYDVEKLQKDIPQTQQIILNRIMASYTWNVSIPNRVIVQQDLVLYLSYFLLNEIYHHVLHTISEKNYVCPNHCLLQMCHFMSCIKLVFIYSLFFAFDKCLCKGITVN